MDMHLLCFLIPEPSRTHMDHLMGDTSVSPSHICMLSRCLGWGSVVLQVGFFPKGAAPVCWAQSKRHRPHSSYAIDVPRRGFAQPLPPPGWAGGGGVRDRS